MKPLDRSEAVNLARNLVASDTPLKPRGRQALAEAVLAMDAELKRLYALPEGDAISLLRQIVNITEHMQDAVWYDGANVRHPAVTPLFRGFAEEVQAYLDGIQPQGDEQ